MPFKLYGDNIITYENKIKIFLFDIYYFILTCGIKILLNLAGWLAFIFQGKY